MTTRNGYLRRSALGLLAVAGLALGGCASPGSMPGTSADGTVQSARATQLDETLSGFLAQAPAGAVVALAESPWGRDVEVIADAPYYAASGRECRHLRIVSARDDGTHQAVACHGTSGWQAQRLVTDSLSTSGTGGAR